MTSASPSQNDDRLTAGFWEGRYQAGTARWDLGQPSPPLVHLMNQHNFAPGRVVVLGCGRGYDALMLAEQGFEVVGVDYAPSAIAAAEQQARSRHLSATFLQRNIFDLVPEYAQQFDYVVEHTCFCALDPALRDRYRVLVKRLLKPGGSYIAVFFTHDRPGGPPYGTDPAYLRDFFGQQFQIFQLTPTTHSVPSRQGEEHIGIFRSAIADSAS